MGLCRLCLTEDESTIDLISNVAAVVAQWFQVQLTYYTSLAMVMKLFVNKQISADDAVSSVICVPCWTVIRDFHLYCCKVTTAQRDLLTDVIFVKHQTISSNIPSLYGSGLELLTFTSDSECRLDKSGDQPECKVEIHSDASNATDSDTPLLECNPEEPKSSEKKRKHVDLSVKRSTDTAKSTNKQNYKLENEQIRQFCTMACELCTESFDSFRTALRHYRECHSHKGYLVCCDQKFFKRFKVVEHIQKHLNPEAFRYVTH